MTRPEWGPVVCTPVPFVRSYPAIPLMLFDIFPFPVGDADAE